MKTFIFITFLLLITGFNAKAQSTFQKLLYSDNFIGEPDIAPANKSDFVITGTLLPNLSPAVVAVIDKNGNTKWSKFYSDGVNSFGEPQIVQTSDSGFVLFASPTSNDPVLLKLDKAGNVLWSVFLRVTAGALNGGRLTTDDGNVLITGRYGADQPVLIKINAINGKIIFAKALSIHPDGKQPYGASLGVLTTNDGGYIICGYTGYTEKFQSYDYMYFAKLNSEGRFITAKVYNRNSELISLVKAKGGYIFTGYNNYNPCYLKIDNRGNVLWSYQISIGKSGYATDIIHNDNGTYTFVVNGASLANIDEDGNLNWYKRAKYKALLIFGGLCTTADNGLVTISKNYFSKKDSCLLLKFDNNGNTCNGVSITKFTADTFTMQPESMIVDTFDISKSIMLDKGNFNTVQMPFYNTGYCNALNINFPGKQTNTSGISINVSPNPVSGGKLNCIIQNAIAGNMSLTISNMEGLVMYERSFVNNEVTVNQQVDASKLHPGLYTIKVANGSSRAFAKFMKQ